MKIFGEELGGVTVLTLRGRMDHQACSGVQHELLWHVHKPEPRLVLDLSQTPYVSSAGIRVLLALAKRIEQQGGKCVLCALGDAVLEVLKIGAFDRIFPICAARDEAVALASA